MESFSRLDCFMYVIKMNLVSRYVNHMFQLKIISNTNIGYIALCLFKRPKKIFPSDGHSLYIILYYKWEASMLKNESQKYAYNIIIFMNKNVNIH